MTNFVGEYGEYNFGDPSYLRAFEKIDPNNLNEEFTRLLIADRLRLKSVLEVNDTRFPIYKMILKDPKMPLGSKYHYARRNGLGPLDNLYTYQFLEGDFFKDYIEALASYDRLKEDPKIDNKYLKEYEREILSPIVKEVSDFIGKLIGTSSFENIAKVARNELYRGHLYAVIEENLLSDYPPYFIRIIQYAKDIADDEIRKIEAEANLKSVFIPEMRDLVKSYI